MHFDVIPETSAPVRKRSRLSITTKRLIAGAFAALVVCLCVIAFVLSAPRSFSPNAFIVIPADISAATFADTLHDAGLIRSEYVFRLLARVSGFDHHLEPGAYVFPKRASTLGVLYRIGTGRHGIAPVRVTFTEGMTSYDMADTLQKQLAGFSRAEFLEAASTSEGYLFPDTYLFMPGDRPEDIVDRLRLEFGENIASITPDILASGHSITDIVILASILEREAQSFEDKRMVAGILWNRIDNDMPLQVDAVFGYIHQQNGYTPTAADLDSESPYNTYTHRGLPPTAISNPGLESLLAAATPTPSKYFYYLTGNDGEMHYGATFDQHKENRRLYLK